MAQGTLLRQGDVYVGNRGLYASIAYFSSSSHQFSIINRLRCSGFQYKGCFCRCRGYSALMDACVVSGEVAFIYGFVFMRGFWGLILD